MFNLVPIPIGSVITFKHLIYNKNLEYEICTGVIISCNKFFIKNKNFYVYVIVKNNNETYKTHLSVYASSIFHIDKFPNKLAQQKYLLDVLTYS